MTRLLLRSFASLSFVLGISPAYACLNWVGTDHQGLRIEPMEMTGSELREQLADRSIKMHWLKRAPTIISEVRAKPDFEHLTNLAVVLVYQGKPGAAIRLLLAIENIFPGRYETAANLGTALELAGQDQTALRWIRIGIQRNRDDHYGTEWLHARILEAKIALKADPTYLQGRSVAGVEFDDGVIPAMPTKFPIGNAGRPVDGYEMDIALSYQLSERLQFVAPPDSVVANLLLDRATLNLAGGPIETAQVLYPLAARYGAKKTDLMTRRLRQIEITLNSAKHQEVEQGRSCAICRSTAGSAPESN